MKDEEGWVLLGHSKLRAQVCSRHHSGFDTEHPFERLEDTRRLTQRSKELDTAVDFTTAIAADARKVLFSLM